MSLSKPILALTAIIVLLGFFYSNHKERPFNRREKIRTKAPPERQKIKIHSLSNNNRSTFVIDLPPGFYMMDDEQYPIPYDFTVPDKDGREVRFKGNLRLVREDEDTLIATPDRDMAYVTGELLAHVIENLSQLVERRINNLHNFTDGYEEGRRNSKKAPSIPTTPTIPIYPPGSKIRPD